MSQLQQDPSRFQARQQNKCQIYKEGLGGWGRMIIFIRKQQNERGWEGIRHQRKLPVGKYKSKCALPIMWVDLVLNSNTGAEAEIQLGNLGNFNPEVANKVLISYLMLLSTRWHIHWKKKKKKEEVHSITFNLFSCWNATNYVPEASTLRKGW